MQPKVSIIIPTFNSVSTLSETLDSVLSQTYFNWECIVVDDGSIDSTAQIVKGYIERDTRFQFYKRPDTFLKGPSASRNYGVEKATGTFLLFLDSDDLLAKNCLENRVVKFKEKPNCDFLVFQMQRFTREPNFSIQEIIIEKNKNKILESFIDLHCVWQTTAPIYRKSFFDIVKGFNERMSVFEDYEVAIKSILKSNNFFCFESVDYFYRNPENYKGKYNGLEMKIKMVESFQELILSLANLMSTNSEAQFKNAIIKKYILKSYKNIFQFYIVGNVSEFKKENKKIIHLLTSKKIISSTDTIRFYFVDAILLPFANIKGSGISRLIKFIYKLTW